MTVIPVKSLCGCIAIWFIADLIDINWLHWFSVTLPELLHTTFWQFNLVLCCWFIDGRKVPA